MRVSWVANSARNGGKFSVGPLEGLWISPEDEPVSSTRGTSLGTSAHDCDSATAAAASAPRLRVQRGATERPAFSSETNSKPVAGISGPSGEIGVKRTADSQDGIAVGVTSGLV